MKKKKEEKYFDNEWKEMTEHLRSFLETADQEQLHKLRVQIKKVRAMLTLIGGISQRQGLMNDFAPVRKIFKYAGHIRDAHTNLQLSERFNLKNELFETGQQQIIEEGVIDFRNKGKKFIKNLKHSHTQLKKQLPKVDNGAIAKYYKKQLENIAVNFTIPGFTEDMHTNRKLIKILIYNHKLADEALNGRLPFNLEYLDKLQESIGKWHDNVVAAQLFSSPELNDKPVVAKIKKMNVAIKRRINTLADDFLNKATTVKEDINLG